MAEVNQCMTPSRSNPASMRVGRVFVINSTPQYSFPLGNRMETRHSAGTPVACFENGVWFIFTKVQQKKTIQQNHPFFDDFVVA
jgi:hypothetical protein